MTPKQKNWIDKASYQDLIDKVHKEDVGSEWFQGDTGSYLMAALRERIERLVSMEAATFPYMNSASAAEVSKLAA